MKATSITQVLVTGSRKLQQAVHTINFIVDIFKASNCWTPVVLSACLSLSPPPAQSFVAHWGWASSSSFPVLLHTKASTCYCSDRQSLYTRRSPCVVSLRHTPPTLHQVRNAESGWRRRLCPTVGLPLLQLGSLPYSMPRPCCSLGESQTCHSLPCSSAAWLGHHPAMSPSRPGTTSPWF